jgi:DNA-binding transcriptional LysR family regulator
MKLNEQDLNVLIVFGAILETRSVSKASERLGMSQPSISHALAKMRQFFDDPMFVRVKNEMQPTPRASLIAPPIKLVLDLARSEIFHQHTFNPATSTRTFTLCMTDGAEASYLSHIINAFRLRAPNARLRTVSPISEALEEGLESGAVDLAIGYFPDIKNAGVFQQQLLRNSGIVCIVGHENRLIPRGVLDAATFSTVAHVAVRTEGRSQEVIEKAMLALGIRREVFLTIPHYLGLLNIISQTELIAVIPLDITDAFELHSGIDLHPLPFPSPKVEITQIWHRKHNKDLANQWLRTLVRDVLQQR